MLLTFNDFGICRLLEYLSLCAQFKCFLLNALFLICGLNVDFKSKLTDYRSLF